MPLAENTNLEPISLIWLDNMADATQENRETQDKFRSVVNYLKVFDNCIACEAYIRHEEHDRIILIVNGRLGQQIIEQIHHLKQIQSVFVFCMDKERNELWAKKYKKVRGVIVELDDLLESIDFDRKIRESIQILSDKDEINPILLDIEYTLIDRRQFLNICYKEYEGNAKQILNIQEFEHLYSSSNAFNYFFKQTFLYRLLIKSFQTFHIDLLFLLRFFLQDIEEQFKSCSTLSVPVYHAQLMTNEQIEFIQKSFNGTTLRLNSFIIAYKNRDDALKSLMNRNDFNLVLFIIEINQIGKEFETYVLFPITTRFQIISIDYQNQIYSIRILVTNSNQYRNKKARKSIEFPYLLRDQGKLDQAEIIFHRLLTQYPSEYSKYYQGLATIAQDKGLYQNSLQLYEKSFSRVSSKSYSHYLNNLGCIYDYLEDYDQALQYYSKCLRVMRNDIDRAMCINNIGITLANQKQYEDALEYFQQSLSIRENILRENHPDLAISYANIGLVYSSLNQPDLAFEYYQKALKGFPDNQTQIFKAIVYQNIAQIFYEKHQLNVALNYYQQSLDIFRKSRPVNHPNVIYLEQMINQVTQTK